LLPRTKEMPGSHHGCKFPLHPSAPLVSGGLSGLAAADGTWMARPKRVGNQRALPPPFSGKPAMIHGTTRLESRSPAPSTGHV